LVLSGNHKNNCLMKTKKCLINLFFIITFSILSQGLSAQNDSIINQTAFQRGEKLRFKLYYHSRATGNVSAGELVSEVKPERIYIDNNPNYHIVMVGKSKGAFNWFFKVRDRFESYIDEHHLLPSLFKKRIREGDYETQRVVHFNQDSGSITYHNLKNGFKGLVKTPYQVQDLVSSIYYIRNWDFTSACIGQKYYLNIFLDDSVHQIQFEYLGIKTIRTKLGRFECLKFKPRVITGDMFAEESPMTIYVSNDRNHLPILAISKLSLGSVRMELEEYEGLRFSLALK